MGDPYEHPAWDRDDPSGALPEDEPPREWVSREALSEILSFELSTAEQSCCPRCRAASFTYARLRFCSEGCPENLVMIEVPARLE